MNISIKATNIELTPALKDYADKRMRGIQKFVEGKDAEIDVEIGKVTSHHKQGEVFEAQVNVVTPLGKQYRAVSVKQDLYEAIDDTRNEIVREITSAKGKRDSLFRRGARRVKNLLKGFR
jgi:putative sigma-54 modulation protein